MKLKETTEGLFLSSFIIIIATTNTATALCCISWQERVSVLSHQLYNKGRNMKSHMFLNSFWSRIKNHAAYIAPYNIYSIDLFD